MPISKLCQSVVKWINTIHFYLYSDYLQQICLFWEAQNMTLEHMAKPKSEIKKNLPLETLRRLLNLLW